MVDCASPAALYGAVSNMNPKSPAASGKKITPFPIKFRTDLIVSQRQDAEGKPLFLIKDPVTKAAFNFGEQEYFLCQAMTGTASVEEIAEAFEKRFKIPISRDDLDGMGDHLRSLNLIESVSRGVEDSGLGQSAQEPAGEDLPDDEILEDPKEKEYRHPLGNPEKVFDVLHALTKPLRPVVMVLNFLL